jgi:hypothetical protein
VFNWKEHSVKINREFTTMEALLLEQEIRLVTYPLDGQSVQGYEWHLLLHVADGGSAWTPWVFGSPPMVESMLEQWQEFRANNKAHPPVPLSPGRNATH